MAKPKTSKKPKSQSDEYFDKGYELFWDVLVGNSKTIENDLSRAYSYMSTGYEEAGRDTEEKKWAAGVIAYILTQMKDYKNAQVWVTKEFGPDIEGVSAGKVWAKFAEFFIAVNQHDSFRGVNLGDSWLGLVSAGFTVAGKKSKQMHFVRVAIETAEAIDNYARASNKPSAVLLVIWSDNILSWVDGMLQMKIREPRICELIANLPWERCSKDELKGEGMKEGIEEVTIAARGFLSRMR